MELELDILWLSKDKVEMMKLGISGVDDGEEETQPVTFYSIDNIQKYEENGKKRSVVISGGSEYITIISYEELKKRIREVKSINN